MSRRCLFDVQPMHFAALWVLQVMAGTWTILQWLFDGACLGSWCVQTGELCINHDERCITNDVF